MIRQLYNASYLNESISSLVVFLWVFFIISGIRIPVNKQCRPCLHAAPCCVWMGPALFAYMSLILYASFKEKNVFVIENRLFSFRMHRRRKV